MLRTHLSSNPLLEFENRSQPMCRHKPSGLWYGIDNSWRRWCEAEDLESWIHLNEYNVKIREEYILVMKSDNDVRHFTKCYSINEGWDRCTSWVNVAKDYSGIEIRNYNRNLAYDHLNDLLWLLTWDCSSGCIWDRNGLESLRPL